ncbi:hypothetical protein F4677DRAFT_402294 [Hypoxylon crocopeplum]|nr:hypothetical protein F4677DRAFT_402294 [Hypoxylon crocopeplum]
MFWPLLVALLATLSDAKNLGPRLAAPLPSPPAVARNDREVVMAVSKDHIFYSNYAKKMSVVSVEEKLTAFGLLSPLAGKLKPKPRRDLWVAPVRRNGDGKVYSRLARIRRSGTPPPFPTDYPEVQVGPDNCLECAGRGSNNPAQIGTFTTTYFISNMLATQDQLLDTCVFYTAVFFPQDYVTWNTYFFPSNQFDLQYKAALSHRATEYACNNNFYSIWMLWPGKAPGGEYPDGVTDPDQGNFWEVYVPGSWLYSISQNNDQGTYFQTMSTSMALQCGGTIRVMSIAPLDMNKYGGTIWINQELRTLRQRLGNDNSRYKPTNLIAIDALTENQYLMNWADLSVQRNLKRGDDLWLDPEELRGLHRRDACDSNIAYEDATRSFNTGDWFG